MSVPWVPRRSAASARRMRWSRHMVQAVTAAFVAVVVWRKAVGEAGAASGEAFCPFGGFETAMMVGLMLVAARRRRLIMVDGMAACAALLVASRIAAPVIDYCVFCRSHTHPGLDRALEMFRASALLELGLQSVDGTGATLAWPLVRTAAALLTEVAEGEDAGPTRPSGMAPGDFGVTFSRATDLPL